MCRVTHHVVQNLPLTSKQKFRHGLAKAELLFWSQWEALHNMMCHPVHNNYPYGIGFKTVLFKLFWKSS